MEAVILVGIPGSGKSTFCRHQFFDTHIRINLDMLRTRNREQRLISFCHDTQTPYILDNTNVTRTEREAYIREAKQNRFCVKVYYFPPDLDASLAHNRSRTGKAQVKDIAVMAKFKQLEPPEISEGMDELYMVRMEEGNFVVLKEG